MHKKTITKYCFIIIIFINRLIDDIRFASFQKSMKYYNTNSYIIVLISKKHV
jgi:hypothetical protein